MDNDSSEAQVRSMPPRSILVGTDGSATAGVAVRRAGALAGALGARLVVLCAFERDEDRETAGAPLGSMNALTRSSTMAFPEDAGDFDGVPGELEWHMTAAGRAEQVAKQHAALAREAGAANVEARSAPGHPVDVLIAEASAMPADLLVVGSKGMKSWSRRLLGSVPNAVSHHAPCDLLIVRTDD